MFALVPEGGYWRDLPSELHREALGGAWAAGGGKTGFYRRLSWDVPSPTITTAVNRKGSALCHPEADRPVSVRECAALQGFPDDWCFAGSMSAQYRQIGNAVPVPLAKAVSEVFIDGRDPVDRWENMITTSCSKQRWPASGRQGGTSVANNQATMTSIRFMPGENPIQRVNERVRRDMVAAQDNTMESVFTDAKAFCEAILDDLRISLQLSEDWRTCRRRRYQIFHSQA